MLEPMDVLFVIASDHKELAPLATGAPHVIGRTVLVCVPEAPWILEQAKGLREVVLELARKHLAVRVYVAGHMKPCFAIVADRFQVRRNDLEELLREALAADIRTEVVIVAFHHEPGCPVFDALWALAKSAEADRVSRIAELGAGFLAEPSPERVSVIKHRIFNLFLPISLRYQLAEEAGAEEAERLRGEALAAFEEKMGQVLPRLNELHALIRECPNETLKADVQSAVTAVEGAIYRPPGSTAAEFHDWLTKLRDAFDALRELFDE